MSHTSHWTPTYKIRSPEWAHIHERDNRIIELEAIVDKLPKTVDGVPLPACESPVVICPDGTIVPVTGWYLYDDGVWGVRVMDRDGATTTFLSVVNNRCYSALEVAEAVIRGRDRE